MNPIGSGWKKGIASWRIGAELYLSVPFTWLVDEARTLARQHNGPVFAGGPAVALMPDLWDGLATIDQPPPVPPLSFHNPLATFTTRGCPNRCPFCAVPKIEGDFQELPAWEPRPILCDNNLLAASRRHFERVIESLKRFSWCDFNQGLEAGRLTPWHVDQLRGLRHPKIRFAFDHLGAESNVAKAVEMVRAAGLKDLGIYVLIGFNDDPESARYRLETVRGWGIWPNPMRYQPLDAKIKNGYVALGWTDFELKQMMRYYSRLRWFGHIPYFEYRPEDLPLLGLGP